MSVFDQPVSPFSVEELRVLESRAKEVQRARIVLEQAEKDFEDALNRAAGSNRAQLPSEWLDRPSPSEISSALSTMYQDEHIGSGEIGRNVTGIGASDAHNDDSPFLDAGSGGFEDAGGSIWDFDNSPLPPESFKSFDPGTKASSSSFNSLFGSSPASPVYPGSISSVSPQSISPHSFFLSSFDATSELSSAASSDFGWVPAGSQSFRDFCGSSVDGNDDVDWFGSADGTRRITSTSSAPPLVPTPSMQSIFFPEQSQLPSRFGRERSTSSTSEARFSPIVRPLLDSPSLSPSLVATTSDLTISDFSLSSSPVMRSNSTGTAGRRSGDHSRKNSIKKSLLAMTLSRSEDDKSQMTSRRGAQRAPRSVPTFNYDPNLIFRKNDKHVFFVFTQTKDHAPEVSERGVTELTLVIPPVNSPLERVMRTGEIYSRDHFVEDRTEYTFGDSSGGKWIVSYTGYSTAIRPLAPITSRALSVANPVHTFIHFPPGTFVVCGTSLPGSNTWWRLQACESRHDKFPGEGFWTARYDKDHSRRPNRIVEHMAKCKHRGVEGDLFPLGKLARAVLHTLSTSE